MWSKHLSKNSGVLLGPDRHLEHNRVKLDVIVALHFLWHQKFCKVKQVDIFLFIICLFIFLFLYFSHAVSNLDILYYFKVVDL